VTSSWSVFIQLWFLDVRSDEQTLHSFHYWTTMYIS